MFNNRNSKKNKENQNPNDVITLSDFTNQKSEEKKEIGVNYATSSTESEEVIKLNQDESSFTPIDLMLNVPTESARERATQTALDIVQGLYAIPTETDDRVSNIIFNHYNNEAQITQITRSENLSKILNGSSFDSEDPLNQADKDIILLSHESYKITTPMFTSNNVISNGPFISPDNYYSMKNLFVENKLKNLSNRYFLNSQSKKFNQNNLLENIKTKNNNIKKHLDNVKLLTYKETFKENNFIDQVKEYALNKKHSNYFGKVFKNIFKDSPKDYIKKESSFSSSDTSFLNINNIKKSDFEISKVKTVYSDYLKIEIDDNAITNSLTIKDSDPFIMSVLIKVASSLKNLSEGACLRHDYKKENDINFDEYNTINNKILNKIPVLTLSHEYNENDLVSKAFKDITSSSYTNILNLNIIKNKTSISYIDNVFTNDKLEDIDHYIPTKIVLNKNLYSQIIHDEDKTDGIFVDEVVGNTTFTSLDKIGFLELTGPIYFDLSEKTKEKLKSSKQLEDIIDNNSFENAFGTSLQSLYNHKYNILEIDAIYYAKKDTSYLVYFDADRTVRTNNESMSAEDYLQCPTFSLVNVHGEGLNVEGWLLSDSRFQQSVDDRQMSSRGSQGGDYQSPQYNESGFAYGNFKGDEKKYVKYCSSRNQNRQRDGIFKIPIDFIDIRFKLLQNMNASRIVYSAIPFSGDENDIEPYASSVRSNSSEEDFEENVPLSYLIDRCWTAVANDSQSPISLDRFNKQYIGYGPVSFRKSNLLFGKDGVNADTLLKREDIRPRIETGEGENLPFVFLSNTNSLLKFNSDDLKNKFLKKDKSLTYSSELFFDRVLLSSSSRESYNKNDFNFNSIISKNIENRAFKAYEIKRNLFNIKKEVLKNNEFYKFLDNINLKIDNHFNNIEENGNYVILHDDNIENKFIYDLNESPFLFEKNDIFYKKNSFNKSIKKNIQNLKNNINDVTAEEIQSFSSFTTIPEYKEFLSEYYPDNFLRNSSTLLARYIKDIHDSILNIDIKDKQKIGFQKLLMSSFTSNDVFKYFMFYVLEKYFKSRDFREAANDPKNFYDNINDKSNNLYDRYLKKIFSYDNLTNQKTYTLRNIDNKILNINGQDIKGAVTDEGISYKFKNRQSSEQEGPDDGSFIMSGGNIRSLVFPYNVIDNKLRLGKLKIFPNFEGYRISGSKKSISQLFLIYTYNYDAYLDKGSEQNELDKSFFNINNVKPKSLDIDIKYIVLDNNNKFDQIDQGNFESNIETLSLNSVKYLERSFVQGMTLERRPGVLDAFIEDPFDEGDPVSGGDVSDSIDDIFSRIPQGLFYDSIISINFEKDLTYALDNEENNVINKISLIIKSLVLYMFDSEEIRNTSSIDLIENNEEKIDKIFNLVTIFIDLFNTNFNAIEELSILKNISRINMENSTNLNNVNNNIFFDESVKNKIVASLISIYNTGTNKNYNIERNAEKAFNATNSDIREYFNDSIYLEYKEALNVLNKSDFLEATCLDLVYAYLNNFENNKEILNITEESKNAFINNLNQDLDFLNAVEEVSIPNIFEDDLKTCKISKRLYSDLFYSNLNEINIKNNISRNTNKDFESLNIFETDVLKNNNKKLLASSGLNLFLENDKTVVEDFNKIDILRFGISYDLANSLKNEKILSFKVYPVNLKYPELEFEPFEFLYTPILTNITPAAINTINGSVSNYIGYYNLEERSFDKKYQIISTAKAEKEMTLLLRNVSNRRTLEGMSDTLSLSRKNKDKLILNARVSSSIKYINECYNSIFDDEKINRLDVDLDNIISNITISNIDNLNQKDFTTIFGDELSNIENFLSREEIFATIENKDKIIKDRVYGVDMFKKIDEKTSILHFYKQYISDAFFDIFSIRISRDALREKIKIRENNPNRLNESDLNYILNNREDFSNSYTYTITVKAY